MLPVAAVAAVALGTLGLVAWARSNKRGPWRRASHRKRRSSSNSAAPKGRGGRDLVPKDGSARSFGDHIIVVGPLGAGARARVYRRGDWEGGATLPEPLYEVCRVSTEAAQLAAMDQIRAAKEREES